MTLQEENEKLRHLLKCAKNYDLIPTLKGMIEDALSQQENSKAIPLVQDEQYPPCDYCGVIPDHHPWHGSGMFNGIDNPHIHACDDCRHMLPARPAQTEQQPVAWVEVKNRHEGPYEFHGIELLDSGKHYLYAAPIA